MPIEYLSYFSGRFSMVSSYLDATFDYLKVLVLAVVSTSIGIYFIRDKSNVESYLHYYYTVYLNL